MLLEVGSFLKVRIPFSTSPHPEDYGVVAESPWVEIVGVLPSERLHGRIVNELVCEDLHGFGFGDVVELERTWIDPKDQEIWQVVGLAKQR
jgi:hypothetical protein